LLNDQEIPNLAIKTKLASVQPVAGIEVSKNPPTIAIINGHT
jgi:hypothetical protein